MEALAAAAAVEEEELTKELLLTLCDEGETRQDRAEGGGCGVPAKTGRIFFAKNISKVCTSKCLTVYL